MLSRGFVVLCGGIAETEGHFGFVEGDELEGGCVVLGGYDSCCWYLGWWRCHGCLSLLGLSVGGALRVGGGLEEWKWMSNIVQCVWAGRGDGGRRGRDERREGNARETKRRELSNSIESNRRYRFYKKAKRYGTVFHDCHQRGSKAPKSSKDNANNNHIESNSIQRGNKLCCFIAILYQGNNLQQSHALASQRRSP